MGEVLKRMRRGREVMNKVPQLSTAYGRVIHNYYVGKAPMQSECLCLLVRMELDPDVQYLASELRVYVDLLFYLLTGVDHCGMVAVTERLAYLSEGEVELVANQVHGDLPGQGRPGVSPSALERLHGHFKMSADAINYRLGGGSGIGGVADVLERLGGKVQVYGRAGESGKGNYAIQRALQLAYVALVASRYELERVLLYVHGHRPGFRLEYGNSGLQLRRLYIGD